jgi:uncharacterized RDD family membrane protein YckC
MEYAGFFKRFVAVMIDGFITASISLVINRMIPLGWILSLFFNVLYFPFFWSSSARATPGKYIMDLAVVTNDGSQLDLKTALIRYFCQFISSALLFFGYIIALFTEKKQTLHDLLAGTVVIESSEKTEEGLLNAWLNQIKSVKK